MLKNSAGGGYDQGHTLEHQSRGVCPRRFCDAELEAFNGHCLNCGRHISAPTAKAWHIVVKAPCPRCGRPW